MKTLFFLYNTRHEENRSRFKIERSRRGDQGDGRDSALSLWFDRGDETKESSDLDLFIDYDPSTKFNALDLIGIKQFLEDELEIQVDVTTRDGLHPMLRHDIEQTALRVF